LLVAHERRNYYREHIVAPLEQRLEWLKQESASRSWPWMREERQRVELEIAEAQRTIGTVEAEIKSIGQDADVLEGIDMDETTIRDGSTENDRPRSAQ